MIDKSSRPDLDLELFQPPTRSWSGRFAVFLAALALFFTLIGIGAGYRHWQRMNIKVTATQETLKQQQQHLTQVPTHNKIQLLESELEKTLTHQRQLLNERLAAIQILEQQTRQFANTVSKQTEQITRIQGQLQHNIKPTKPQEWQSAEVQFLLKLANREWQIAQNKTATLAALKEADQVLVNLSRVEYLPTRQQIARDIGRIETYQGLDSAYITSQMNQLRHSLTLPKALTPDLEAQLTPTDSSRSLTGWERYASEAKALWSQSFTIRQTDQPLPTILDAASSQQLYQLTLVRLETLQLLLLQGNEASIQNQFQLLIETLQQHYPKQQAAALIQQLEQLQQMTRTIQRPPLESLAVFNSVTFPANSSEVQR
ncbi:MAG: uroporphyrinogen-III C-methyltransferase [Thiofilum sp.]|uniref:uroporphyrinogen-III C-methyltransferase n=1 Tax=Thiofilum sp. TaxID=2212733 RepID=UPI0025ED8E0C|nr:uroporphyrinogen-III C-methyltransferase [Thiofilum sp.]MBK8452816.1 uroporphyrinogen-III C-methyltransferase [Thiofilum sp.]